MFPKSALMPVFKNTSLSIPAGLVAAKVQLQILNHNLDPMIQKSKTQKEFITTRSLATSAI